MEAVPDAPEIREAELYGYPPYDDPAVICPVCGKECETIYTDKDGDAFGCDLCVTAWDSYQWFEENREE